MKEVFGQPIFWIMIGIAILGFLWTRYGYKGTPEERDQAIKAGHQSLETMRKNDQKYLDMQNKYRRKL